MKKDFVFAVFLVFGISLYSQTENFTQGEKLFKENNPSDAVQVLESEIQKKNITENSYNFLGLAYYQLGEYEKSVDAFSRGLKIQPENAEILYFNQGNSYYALKDYSSAAECFSRALSENPDFSMALLNRANALLMDDKLKNARESYSEYIKKNPDDVQKERILLILDALDEEIARREELLREQNRLLWEEVDASIGENSSDSDEIEWELVDFLYDDEYFASVSDFSEENSQNDDVESPKSWEEVQETVISSLFSEAEELKNWESVGDVELSAISDENKEISDEEKSVNSWESVNEGEISVISDDKKDSKDWEQISDGEVEN